MPDLLSIRNSPGIIADRSRAIDETMLRLSSTLQQGNFTVITIDDLSMLFNLYDQQYFSGDLTKAVADQADGPLIFRLSSTMTRAGGKTIRTRIPRRDGTFETHYEIAIASRLLFMTFRDIERPIMVCGLVCTDRLMALQRIMEHEILHLAEMLTWGKSSCAAPRFKSLAMNIFGHPDTKHSLVTPYERAAVQHAIHIGSPVEFHFAGQRLRGQVNRIHHRATVLVESSAGVPYRNGKRYQKYYVPLGDLRVLS
jgi:hypothetical protein